MRSAVNAFFSWSGPAALQVALLVGAAAADDGALAVGSRQSGSDRWVPSLAVTSGITIQNWTGAVSNSCVNCSVVDTAPNPDVLVPTDTLPGRSAQTGDDLDVTPFVGGDFELMTPELPLPTSPRLFVGTGLMASFGTERRVASEGNPGSVSSPLPPTSATTAFSEEGALGQGSETAAQLDTVVYGARAGIAFPLKLLGREFRLKPSVGWIRYDIDASGVVSDAECLNATQGTKTNCNPGSVPVPFPQPTDPPAPGFLRSIQLAGSASDSFDGIGGGLDIEMDTTRIGPLGCSLFAGVHAFKILGSRELDFGGSASFPNDDGLGLAPAETSARFDVEVDAVMVRVGLGLRLHWLGSGD
jgi:hypothetical protein